MPPRQQQRSEAASKPLVPHPSLPVNPMTYQPTSTPAAALPSYPQTQAPQGIPMMPNYMQQVPMMYAPTGIPIPGYMPQGHFNPATAFRQAIFQQPVYGMPTQTPEGYSYSSTYLQQQQQQQQQQAQQQFQARPQPVATSSKVVLETRTDPESSRPAKRSRPNPQASTSTSSSTAAPSSALSTRTKIPLRKGQSESTQGFWRNCSSPGCVYVGPDKEVVVHEGDRHLIFKDQKVGKVSEEEEEAARKVGGPRPAIPGTSIVLETDEDIARWIAERKARWPTSSRVAQKEKERQEKIARGELNPDDTRGNGRGSGRGRGRGRGGQERGRGRGSGQNQSGRGRDSGYGNRAGAQAQNEEEAAGDEESGDGSSDASSDSADDEEDHGEDKIDADDAQAEDDEEDDDDAPPETHNVRTRVAAISDAPDLKDSDSGRRAICRAFARTGRCKFGNKCRYEHTTNDKEDNRDKEVDEETTKFQGPINPFARPSLLSAMLERPMRQTLLTLTEAIDFIVDNEFFDGVELIPGQADELERELNKITEVDAQPGDT